MTHVPAAQLTPWLQPEFLKPLALGAVAMGGIAGVAVLMLWLAGVFHDKTPTVSPAPDPQSVGVGQLVPVRRIRRPLFEVATGTVKPVHEVAIASKLLAKVLEVRVKAGQAVKSGELLVKLDDEALVARLQQAEAAYQAAIANRDRTAADLARAKKLVASNVVTQAEYDTIVAAAKSSSAEVERIRRTIDEARILSSYAQVKSPISGTVVDKRVEAGDTVAPGQVMLTLYDPTHMQMVATVRESLATRLQVGQQVPARLESLGYECQATISEIVPEANVASRSFQVKVTGPCPPGVYSGMFGRLQIPLEDEDVVVIPVSAVRRVGQLAMVEVASDGRMERRSVQLGRVFGDDQEVLAGLRVGESVRIATKSTDVKAP